MSDLEKVKQDGFALEFIQNQTEEICMAAVKENGYALQFVEQQTEAICLEAVKGNGYALKFIENQTKELCLAAVKRSLGALQYVQPHYFKTTANTLRLRALFDPKLNEYIKNIEKEMKA